MGQIQNKQVVPLDFNLVMDYTKGYRSREDSTNLPAGVLISGSHDVLTNTANRIANRKGYVLDGAADTTLAGILSSFDWEDHQNKENHLRAGFLTTAGNDGKLQYRYVASDGTVTWRDLMTSLTSTSFNFTTWWDNTELKQVVLFVNSSSYIYKWSGATTTYASCTSNTITKQGTTTWNQAGFYTTGTRQVVLNGVTYTYTGGENTTTLTGVTPDPTAGGQSVGDVIHQAVVTTANSSITGISATFRNDLIASLGQQVYLGSTVSATLYISKLNNYLDFSYTSPVRVVGEGALATLDSVLVAFAPQESSMYIAAGKGFWYETKFDLSGTDQSKERFNVQKLKTASNQAARSQACVTKDKNNVMFISNEPVLTTLGRVSGVISTPMSNDISFPIINDFNSYDFTDASVFYHKNFIYIAVPREGIVRIFNQTNAQYHYWEAPQYIPVSRFSVIDGELYGHSYTTSETYKLFSGYQDRYDPSTQVGYEIHAVAVFAWQNYGTRSRSKGFNQYFTEGYIAPNTSLKLGLRYDIDGCATIWEKTLDGSNKQFVCIKSDNNSIGKEPLGSAPLGGNLDRDSGSLPPKFRWIPTMPINYFYEVQPYFESRGKDLQWELIAHGAHIVQASDLNVNIKD